MLHHDAFELLNAPMKKMALELKGAVLATGYVLLLLLPNSDRNSIVQTGCVLLSTIMVSNCASSSFPGNFPHVCSRHTRKKLLIELCRYLVDPLVEVIDVSPRYFLCICTQSGRLARRTSRGCSRAFASLCAVVTVCVFFALLGYITVLSVYALDMTPYQEGYNHLVAKAERVSGRVGVPLNITTTLHDNVERLARIFLTETMDILSFVFVTIIYLTYFLCTRTRASDAGGVWSKIDRDIQRFVTLKCFLSLFVALLVTVVYVWLNVGLAILWGILTFLLNWIPNVGAMVASLIPVLIIVITPSSVMNTMEKLLAVLMPMCLHAFVGNFIEPRVFGKKLEMDPVIVILSLSTWGLLWGVVGMILSVPLTAAFKIMLSHLKLWPEVVALMEGRYFAKYGARQSPFVQPQN